MKEEYSCVDIIIDPHDERVKVGDKYGTVCASKGCIDSANKNITGGVDHTPTTSQKEILNFNMEELFVKSNHPVIFTDFHSSNLTQEERAGMEHLIEMMLVARQQIILRKVLHHK